MKLDLHAHTTFSDGDMTPQQVAALAVKTGLDGVAITDHDECRGFGDIKPVQGLILIPGIEIAASEAGSEVHVLGLDIDWRHEAMAGYAGGATGRRRQRAQAVVDRLRAAGYDLDMEDVDRECRGCAIGRPHIALALVKKGYAESVDDAFARFISREAPFYVPLDKISAAQAAELILKSGGKPVLAHPGLLKPGVFDSLTLMLKNAGFWGMEAYHPSHSDGQCRLFESEARRLGLFVTSGSDFHGGLGQGTALGGETRGGAYLKASIDNLVGSLKARL